MDKVLPSEQFGFRQGRGTGDAIHMLQSEVERVLKRPKSHLYAVFIDCVKAFDKASRHLIVDSLRQAGVGGYLLQVISSFFDHDTLLVEGENGNI